MLTVEQIWKVGYFSTLIREKVAIELLASWPIPYVRDKGKIGFYFFYYASFGPPPAKENNLYPPSWVAAVAREDGAVEELRRIEPEDVDLHVPRGQPFATHRWPEQWTLAQVNEDRVKLLTAYDKAVAIWEAVGLKALPVADPSITSFCEQFLGLTQPPYLPCYRKLGPAFFSWISPH